MIEISNRHFETLLEKLPRVLRMARDGTPSPTLRQSEDIRQLHLLCRQLRNKRAGKMCNSKKRETDNSYGRA